MSATFAGWVCGVCGIFQYFFSRYFSRSTAILTQWIQGNPTPHAIIISNFHHLSTLPSSFKSHCGIILSTHLNLQAGQSGSFQHILPSISLVSHLISLWIPVKIAGLFSKIPQIWRWISGTIKFKRRDLKLFQNYLWHVLLTLKGWVSAASEGSNIFAKQLRQSWDLERKKKLNIWNNTNYQNP